MDVSAVQLMGIVNRTPDSFFSGSRVPPDGNDVQPALLMAAEGADILDVGGESSRPGSAYVSADEEIRRVVPFIRELRKHTSVLISVDTRKAKVAQAALAAGANIINDISALCDDNELAGVVAAADVPVVLMHMAGTPATMQNNPRYSDVVGEVEGFLMSVVDRALRAGIARRNIIVDPGIGFGKTWQHNIALIQAIPRLKTHGYPVLLGLSRKSLIGVLAGTPESPLPVDERLVGSAVANLMGACLGADILRVHDVAASRQALSVFTALWPKAQGDMV